MFEKLTIHGGKGDVLYGYRPAAVFREWRIFKHEGQWRLVGALVRAEPFLLRKGGLLFTAPHEKSRDGMWCWQVTGDLHIEGGRLTARLGPPEQ